MKSEAIHLPVLPTRLTYKRQWKKYRRKLRQNTEKERERDVVGEEGRKRAMGAEWYIFSGTS